MKNKNYLSFAARFFIILFSILLLNCGIFGKVDKGINAFVKSLLVDRTVTAVTSVLPKDKSKENYMNTSIYVVFNKIPSNLDTTNFTASSDGGKTKQEGTITVTDKVGSFIPTGNFLANSTYTVTISGAGLTTPYTFSFSTNAIVDNTPPTIANTNPFTGDTEIPINTKITATFSESIAPNSVNSSTMTLTGGITGTVAINDQTISFTPNGNYAANTIYAVTIKTGPKDLAGNKLASPYSWTFTSGSTVGTNCQYDVSIFNTCFFE